MVVIVKKNCEQQSRAVLRRQRKMSDLFLQIAVDCMIIAILTILTCAVWVLAGVVYGITSRGDTKTPETTPSTTVEETTPEPLPTKRGRLAGT